MNINAQRVELEMAKRGLSRRDLAERSGISAQNISTIIRRGTCEPRTAGKLATGLEMDVSELMGEG